MQGWVVGSSLNLSFYVLEKCEDGFHGPHISGLSSLEPLISPYLKPEPQGLVEKNLKDF